MGTKPAATGQRQYDVAGATSHRLVAQKKTVGASERDETARDTFRQVIAALMVEDVVVIDESGTHLVV